MKTTVEIIYTLVRAELKTEANTSYLGWLWWLLDPAMSLVIYYLAFGLIMRQDSPGFIPFLCVGIVFWRWFQSSVMRGASAILASAPLFNKVQVRKFIFPLSTACADFYRFSIALAMLIVFLLILKTPVTIHWLWLPLLVLTQFCFILFLATLCSIIIPFFPDLRNMIGHAMHLLFFLSGIFFDPQNLGGRLKTLVLLNPVSGLLSAVRKVLLEDSPPDFAYVGTVLGISLLGILVLERVLNNCDKMYGKLA